LENARRLPGWYNGIPVNRGRPSLELVAVASNVAPPIISGAWGRHGIVRLRTLAVLLLTACGGVAERPQPSASAVAERQAAAGEWDVFCTEVSTALARLTFSCLGVPELAPTTARWSFCDATAASIAADRIRLQRESMAACLDSVPAMRCEQWLSFARPVFPCPLVLVGTVPRDHACLADADCANPALYHCAGTGCWAGTCKQRLADGAACGSTTDDACLPASVCDGSMGDATCTRIAGKGEPCGSRIGVCDLGLACGRDGACVSSQPGTDCSADANVCGLAMGCFFQDSGMASQCSPLHLPGESCDAAEVDCLNGAYCDGVDGRAGTCLAGARIGDRCGPLLRGADITAQVECLDGYCDRMPGALSGACQPYKVLGQPCVQDEECDEGAGRFCLDGACAADTCGETW
jgi:hypothetical protein